MTTISDTSFDLTTEPWLPVLVGGLPRRASLREIVERPEQYALDLADPLAAVAVLRQVLLPIWIDALGLPVNGEAWEQRRQQPRAGAGQLLDYLDEHASRFDLFDAVAPFAQVAGLQTAKQETKPVSLLMPNEPTGNNVPLFAARTEKEPPALTPADAALALLVALCFDTAAIKSGAVGDPAMKAGKTTGNPTGPVGQLGVLVPLGADLAETLCLNSPHVDQTTDVPAGTPHWRRAPLQPAWRERSPDGLLDLLTWSSRRIRLVPEDQGRAVVVRAVVLAAGDRLRRIPDYEIHTGWKQNPQPKADEPTHRPRRHPSGQSVWRGMQGLLATGPPTRGGETSTLLLRQLADLRADELVPPDLRLELLAAQVAYGNQSAIVEDVFSDLLPLPLAALPHDSPVRQLLVTMAQQADELRIAANRLGDTLREAAGGDRIPWDRSQRLGDTLVQDLTATVRRVLSGLQREPEKVEDAGHAWRVVARQRALDVAEPVLSSAPATTFEGRLRTHNGREYPLRLGTAEAAYRHALTEVLGPVQHQEVTRAR